MHRKFVQAFHVPGSLGADLNIRWTVPSDCQLVHVSATNSTAYGFGINIGPSTDTDGYLALATAGVSNVPVEFARANFVGAQYPHPVDGTIIVIEVDYNYNGGGSAQASANVTIVLTFQEG